MISFAFHAALAASMLVSLAPASRVSNSVDPCTFASTDISAWPIVRSPRVPGLTLRLPRSFEREPEQAPPASSASSASSARWTHAANGQLVIARGAVPAGMIPPSATSAPSYRRCEERVGSAVAVIEAYDQMRSPGALTGVGSFHVQARFRWPDGEELVVLGDAADRERFGELLAALRTIRRTSA